MTFTDRTPQRFKRLRPDKTQQRLLQQGQTKLADLQKLKRNLQKATQLIKNSIHFTCKRLVVVNHHLSTTCDPLVIRRKVPCPAKASPDRCQSRSVCIRYSDSRPGIHLHEKSGAGSRKKLPLTNMLFFQFARNP